MWLISKSREFFAPSRSVFLHPICSTLKSIEEEYGIKSKATGWVGQIDILATKLETTWITTFKKQSLKILTKNLNESIRKEFTDSIKKRISSKVFGIKNHFRRDWIIDWFGIVNLEAVWFTDIWSKKELQLLTDLSQAKDYDF